MNTDIKKNKKPNTIVCFFSSRLCASVSLWLIYPLYFMFFLCNLRALGGLRAKLRLPRTADALALPAVARDWPDPLEDAIMADLEIASGQIAAGE